MSVTRFLKQRAVTIRAPGTYTLFSQAEDGYGAFGDPLALSFQVL